MSRKSHLSVSLSSEAVAFVDALGEKHFSTAIEKIIHNYQQLQPDHIRAEALAQLRSAAKTLSASAPNEAILAWTREAIRK